MGVVVTLRERLDILGEVVTCSAMAESVSATLEDVDSRSRALHVCAARRLLYRHFRSKGWSYTSIGQLFSRDAATVMYALCGKKSGRENLRDVSKLRGDESDFVHPFLNRLRMLDEGRREFVWQYVQEKANAS